MSNLFFRLQLDKDNIIFRRQTPPIKCSWFSISFNRGDLLRLIDAPEEMIQPVKEAFGALLQKDGMIEMPLTKHDPFFNESVGWKSDYPNVA